MVKKKKEMLDFYDVKGKEKFKSNDYRLVTKKTKRGMKKFAIARAPSGIEAWRIVPMSFK